jgi:UDP-N-acetylglucosamine acyltransferase
MPAKSAHPNAAPKQDLGGLVHSTAFIAPGAKLHPSVAVGPFCTIGPQVSIGEGTRLISHVVLTGQTTLGKHNIVYPFASIGQPSPDRKFKGEETTLIIGDGNDIREGVTMHVGTAAGGGTTRVGNANLFMAGSHVAHDCMIGNHCIIANYAQLAGHVEVADYVNIGGLSGIHQRVRIGTRAIVGGHTAVDHDVPPFASVAGKRASLKGLNLIGLRRQGMEKALIHALDEAYDYLFEVADDNVSLQERASRLKRRSKQPELKALATFVLNSQRGVTCYADDEA